MASFIKGTAFGLMWFFACVWIGVRFGELIGSWIIPLIQFMRCFP